MNKLTRTEPIESELQRNKDQIALKKWEYRDAWIEVIESNGPYACLLTLQFQRCYPDSVTLPAANQFFYNLNRVYFGRSLRVDVRPQWRGGLLQLQVERLEAAPVPPQYNYVF